MNEVSDTFFFFWVGMGYVVSKLNVLVITCLNIMSFAHRGKEMGDEEENENKVRNA